MPNISQVGTHQAWFWTTAWLITLVVGLVIWSFYRDKLPHPSFVIVASSMSALLMLGWRGAYRVVLKRR